MDESDQVQNEDQMDINSSSSMPTPETMPTTAED